MAAAPVIITNGYGSFNGTDLSDHILKITVIDNRAEVDVTTMGTGFTQLTKGLGSVEIAIDFLQEFAASKTHATLQGLVGSTSSVVVEVRAVNAARSVTNPGILMSTAMLFEYRVIDNQVGEAMKLTSTFKNGPGGAGITYPTS